MFCYFWIAWNAARYEAALARVEARVRQLQNYLDASAYIDHGSDEYDASEMELVAARLDEINKLVELWAYED